MISVVCSKFLIDRMPAFIRLGRRWERLHTAATVDQSRSTKVNNQLSKFTWCKLLVECTCTRGANLKKVQIGSCLCFPAALLLCSGMSEPKAKRAKMAGVDVHYNKVGYLASHRSDRDLRVSKYWRTNRHTCGYKRVFTSARPFSSTSSDPDRQWMAGLGERKDFPNRQSLYWRSDLPCCGRRQGKTKKKKKKNFPTLQCFFSKCFSQEVLAAVSSAEARLFCTVLWTIELNYK